MMIDGQDAFRNFKCVDCQIIISQCDITTHQEKNHDVLIVNPFSSFRITKLINGENE